ncbi:hypothetical protein CBS101457_001158 [Exobasidium rhododendri]|nr:hypothetical protein CBS101457_001158 [Exobasidium rhododendri]
MAARGVVSSGGCIWKRCTTTRGFCTSITRRWQDGNVIDTLASRSLLAQVTAPTSLRKHLNGVEKRAVYVGVDPSADSLHVGNLLPLVAALHFVRHGHQVVIVIGGATGSIGDPSGRDSERSALSRIELERNVSKITVQIQDFCAKAGNLLLRRNLLYSGDLPTSSQDGQAGEIESGTPMQEAAQASTITQAEVASEMAMNEVTGASGTQTGANTDIGMGQGNGLSNVTVVNNQFWYQDMNILTFLRDVGKFARVGTMLARDSVKSRMQPSDTGTSSQASAGLSFTEFSYQLLQAYDFSVLHGAPWHCTVQLGGSDQMGNIMAGVDLIRKQKAIQDRVEPAKDSDEAPAYGLTLPLLTTSSGAKFGKSAGNAVWLSAEKCSDYDFYQFFYRSRDDEIELYLKTLTMLSLETIESILRAQKSDPSSRRAQKILANEVTELVRGRKAVKRAETASKILFETEVEGLEVSDVLEAFKGDPRLQMVGKDSCIGVDLRAVAVEVGLTKTKSEAKRVITGGGFYINNVSVKDANRTIQQDDLICGNKIVVLRVGKTEHRIVSVQ